MFLAFYVYPSLSYSGFDLWVRIELLLLHTLPLASSLTNFILTDIVFPKEDGKIIFGAGVTYMICNALGSQA